MEVWARLTGQRALTLALVPKGSCQILCIINVCQTNTVFLLQASKMATQRNCQTRNVTETLVFLGLVCKQPHFLYSFPSSHRVCCHLPSSTNNSFFSNLEFNFNGENPLLIYPLGTYISINLKFLNDNWWMFLSIEFEKSDVTLVYRKMGLSLQHSICYWKTPLNYLKQVFLTRAFWRFYEENQSSNRNYKIVKSNFNNSRWKSSHN